MGHDVFISHSAKDKKVADAVCAALEANGIRCWIAPRDIIPGESWAGSILKGIASSHFKGDNLPVELVSWNDGVWHDVAQLNIDGTSRARRKPSPQPSVRAARQSGCPAPVSVPHRRPRAGATKKCMDDGSGLPQPLPLIAPVQYTPCRTFMSNLAFVT